MAGVRTAIPITISQELLSTEIESIIMIQLNLPYMTHLGIETATHNHLSRSPTNRNNNYESADPAVYLTQE
jgi:hypothetical protein